MKDNDKSYCWQSKEPVITIQSVTPTIACRLKIAESFGFFLITKTLFKIIHLVEMLIITV